MIIKILADPRTPTYAKPVKLLITLDEIADDRKLSKADMQILKTSTVWKYRPTLPPMDDVEGWNSRTLEGEIHIDCNQSRFLTKAEAVELEKYARNHLGLAGHGADSNLVQTSLLTNGLKIGDRIKGDDNFIGVITSINDRCITAKSAKSIQSWNLELCKTLPTLTSLEESEPLVSQPKTLAKSQVLPTAISAQTRKKSTVRTSRKSQSTAISAITVPPKALTSLQAVSPVQELVEAVNGQDLTTKNLNCGLNICDVSKKDSPDLRSSKIPQDYSIAEWELSCKAYPRAGILANGRLSALDSLAAPNLESASLSLPTLTTGLGSGRNAGATRCEKFVRDNGFLLNTQVLSSQMMALLFNFPSDWTQCLQEPPKEKKIGTSLGNCLVEQSTLIVPPSRLNEFSTLIEFSVNSIDAITSLSPRTTLADLQSEANALIAQGASPKGVWIERSKPSGKDFVQACWRSDKPHPWLSDRKTKYIGKYDGDAHVSAMAQFDAGKRLKVINKQIKEF